MTAMGSFVAGPPADHSSPWRVVVDGSRSNGMALGDARIPPGAPGPGRHVHTHEDEGIYVVAGVLTVEVGDERHEVGAESFVWLPAKSRMCSPTSARRKCGRSASSAHRASLGCFVSRPSTLRPFKVPPIPKCCSRSASDMESARPRDHRSSEGNLLTLTPPAP
jgi:hypothetical protein